MKTRHYIFSLGVFVHSGAAIAQCEVGYTAAQLGSDMSTMSSALRGADAAAFREAGNALERGLPCIEEPMAPVVLANVYRYMGLHSYFGTKEAKARAWFRSALEQPFGASWQHRR